MADQAIARAVDQQIHQPVVEPCRDDGKPFAGGVKPAVDRLNFHVGFGERAMVGTARFELATT